MKDAESYRQHYKIAKEKLEQRTEDYHMLKAQFKVLFGVLKYWIFVKVLVDTYINDP